MNESILGEVGFHLAVLRPVNGTALPLREYKSSVQPWIFPPASTESYEDLAREQLLQIYHIEVLLLFG